MIRNAHCPLIVRGWAFALLREHAPEPANANFNPGEVQALGLELQTLIDAPNKRTAYMACTLAGYFPDLIQLEPFLEKCQEDSLLFVREAARLALLRAREIRDLR